MMFRNALAFTLALVACNSIAASFDCSKAANFAESSICNDGYLSGVDSILARSYQKALAETEHPDELRQSQREWLSVRDQCTTQKCLDQTLGARVTFLDSYSRVEKSKAYAAEEKLRKDEYEAQRQAEDLATHKEISSTGSLRNNSVTKTSNLLSRTRWLKHNHKVCNRRPPLRAQPMWFRHSKCALLSL